MADMTLLYNYKGAAYPVELDKLVDEIHSEPHEFPSLVDLTCQKITQDSSTTRRTVQVIPRELCYSLLKAALFNSRDRAIEVLVATWPWPNLQLRKFAPSLFDSIRALYKDSYMNECIKRGVKYTTCLAHTFVECLKNRSPTALKSLDLSGYPTAEVIVNYLSSHVLLVYNEARQKEIINMYNAVAKDLPDEKRQWFSLDSTLPEDSYIITLDAFLQTAETHMELCRALKTSRMEQCRFKLRLNKLDIMCLGVARISILLEQVDSTYLTGLCLQFNGLSNEGMMVLAPSIEKLKHMTALDLSCNSINISGSQEVHDRVETVVAKMLAGIPCLKRLDISNNRTKHKLRSILSGMESSLEYLKMCGCGLSAGDLIYLKHSHHIKSLRELDISGNNLFGLFNHVLCVLEAASPTLNVLELEETDLEEMNLLDLFQNCKHMLQNVYYWNLSKNVQLTQLMLNDAISVLMKMPSLRVLKLSYPVECYISIDEEEIEEEKIAYDQRISELLKVLCEKKKRAPLKFVLVP